MREGMLFSVDNIRESGSVHKGPVSHHFLRRPSFSLAPVPVNHLDYPEIGRDSNLVECFVEGFFDGVCRAWGVCDINAELWRHCEIRDRNRSEFPTTLTELNAIAAAAIAGFRSPAAASGIPTTL